MGQEIKNVKRDKEGYVESFDVRPHHNEEPDAEPAKWIKIMSKGVITASKKLLAGDVIVHREIAAQFIGNWDTDSDGVDCVIQVLVFGSIVYG